MTLRAASWPWLLAALLLSASALQWLSAPVSPTGDAPGMGAPLAAVWESARSPLVKAHAPASPPLEARRPQHQGRRGPAARPVVDVLLVDALDARLLTVLLGRMQLEGG